MRVWILLAVVALSGCMGPDSGDDSRDSFVVKTIYAVDGLPLEGVEVTIHAQGINRTYVTAGDGTIAFGVGEIDVVHVQYASFGGFCAREMESPGVLVEIPLVARGGSAQFTAPTILEGERLLATVPVTIFEDEARSAAELSMGHTLTAVVTWENQVGSAMDLELSVRSGNVSQGGTDDGDLSPGRHEEVVSITGDMTEALLAQGAKWEIQVTSDDRKTTSPLDFTVTWYTQLDHETAGPIACTPL